MEASPDSLTWQTMYKLLTGSVVPRPIAWVSTLNADDQPNLAPFSFFNAVCSNPPHVVFCPVVRGSDGNVKDTLANVRATGEFVVNMVTEATAQAMVTTSGEYASDVNEFELAGVTSVPSHSVKPPRVAESPIHFECTVAHILDINDEPGGGSLVVGRVVHFHIDDAIMYDGDKIDITQYQPIGRLAGPSYAHINNVFELQRPKVQK